ncbi:MAG: aldo/keto reductase [Deltaproteobacteria bacterium]|nr:MAG: aldo/keto reductase [Deltaproteobacteria bacterium]
MKYNYLGHTGLRVSELCMGCMTFGTGFFGIGQVDRDGARALVGRAIEGGINFFDTADIYSRGESERLLGAALSDLGVARDSVVIATKVRGPMSDAASAGTGDVNNVGLSRKHIISSCEASLKRLGTDYIDLYQIHGVDAGTPIQETMAALDNLVQRGLVRYAGCSNLHAWQIVKANAAADAHGGARFVSLQAFYALAARDLEIDLLPMCRSEGVGVMVWSPLAGGFLSGKFRRDASNPDGSRRAGFDFPPIDKELAYDVVDALDAMAKEKGATIPQLALAWLLHQAGVTTVIIGAKKMSQLEDNLGAPDVRFSDAELARLDEVAKRKRVYPEWMIQRQAR